MFHSPLGLIAAEDSSSGGGAAIFQLFFFGLIFVAMYFLLIRPQRRRTREAQELNRALAEGDEVQTASGLVGFITGFDKEDQAGDVAWIEIAEASRCASCAAPFRVVSTRRVPRPQRRPPTTPKTTRSSQRPCVAVFISPSSASSSWLPPRCRQT